MPTDVEVIEAIARRFPDAVYDRRGQWSTNFVAKTPDDFGDYIEARSDILTRYKIRTDMGRTMVFYDVVDPQDNPASAAHEWQAAYDAAQGDRVAQFILHTAQMSDAARPPI